LKSTVNREIRTAFGWHTVKWVSAMTFGSRRGAHAPPRVDFSALAEIMRLSGKAGSLVIRAVHAARARVLPFVSLDMSRGLMELEIGDLNVEAERVAAEAREWVGEVPF